MHTIDVVLPTQSHQILIEPGRLGHLGEAAREMAPHERALLAVDGNVIEPHGRVTRESLEAAGYEVLVHELVADEQKKTLQTVQGLYAAMLAFRLERGSPVIALGGGVVGDVAGFAAATYLRGVPLLQAPTTLLAMVDASIGGKTGVNYPLPSGAAHAPELGKNLVGAFWQPRAVVIDPLALATLAPRDFRCGLAECIKHGVLADAGLFAFIESNIKRISEMDVSVLTELIARSARVKVAIVQEDEREAGRRALLNLGHTFAHAIEPIEALDLKHGEAVAIGLCAAARCACETGRLDRDVEERIARLLADAGLPTRLPRPVEVEPLINTMGYDKKVAGGRMRLILPTALGRARIVQDVPEQVIVAAWRAVGAAPASSRGQQAC